MYKASILVHTKPLYSNAKLIAFWEKMHAFCIILNLKLMLKINVFIGSIVENQSSRESVIIFLSA